MKKRILTLISCISLISHLYATSENLEKKDNDYGIEEEKIKPHNFCFGPDIFLMNYYLDVDKDIEFKQEGYYAGLRLRYEYIREKAPYVGTDLFASWGWQRAKFEANDAEVYLKHENAGFGNAELRLGFPVFIDKCSVVPFGGLGEYFTYRLDSHYLIHFDFFYVAGGYRFNYKTSPTFSVGQNTKIHRIIGAKVRADATTIEKSKNVDAWGMEIAVPLKWLVDKNWTIQLEPYYFRLDFSEVQDIFGFRLFGGYHF